MRVRGSAMETTIRGMIADGKSDNEIAKLTGVNYRTVVRYRNEMPGIAREVEKVVCNSNFPPGFQQEWTLAVNRIRKYLGKELFPMPEERRRNERV